MQTTTIIPRTFSKFVPKCNAACNTPVELKYTDPQSGCIRVGFPKNGILGVGYLEYTILDAHPGKKTMVISSLIDVCPQNRIEIFFNNVLITTLKTTEPNGIQTKTDNIHMNLTTTGNDILQLKFHKTDRQIRDCFMLLFRIYIQ